MSTFKLGVILIALIGAAYFYKGPAQDLGKQENFLSNINVEEIKTIEIAQDGVTTTLEKVDGKLKIEGTKDFYVDEEVAQSILDALSETKNVALDLVSASSTKKQEFQTDESGINVNIVQEGEDAVNFVIGKLSSNFKDNYISSVNLSDTYAVAKNLISIFNQDEWRSKRIFKTDSDKITKIRFQRPNDEFIVEKTSTSTNEWKGVSPLKFNVNAENIKEVVEIMTDLVANKIPEQKFEGTGLEQHLLIVQATGEEVNNTIMIGVENEGLFYAKSGNSDNIYLISKEDKEKLDKQIADLTE